MEAVKDYGKFTDRVITGNLNRMVERRALVKAGHRGSNKPFTYFHISKQRLAQWQHIAPQVGPKPGMGSSIDNPYMIH